MRAITILFLSMLSLVSFGQKTESPYLKVITKDAIIPLKSTKADVQITGKIAHVKIIQTYQNKGRLPLEAKYLFPMSTKAAVHDMQMTIGQRTIKAIVYEKKKAKKVYDKAIKKGKRAAKLDQKRPNVFQMNVGNVMPGEEISIEISYTELLSQVNGEYEFVFPGVVGPRFTGESSGENTFNTQYTQKGISDTYDYDLSVCINAGMIIQKLYSKTHKIDVNYPDASSAEAKLSEGNINPSNRDFILKYDLRSKSIESGMLLYEGKNENFFSLLVEPPKNTPLENVSPREYLFVVDVSGSMMGYPIEVAKSLMKNLLGNLHDDDLFNILLFSADNKVFKPKSVNVNNETLEEAFQFLKGGNNYGGGTRLLNALEKAYQLPRENKAQARTMVVITDGYVNVEKDAFSIIENNLDKANVVTFGIGSGVNRYLLEGMARVGKSESFIATSKQESYHVAEKFRKYIASPLLTQIKLSTTGCEIYNIEPKTIPDVFADRPIMIYGKYKGEAKGSIQYEGWQGNKKVIHKIPLNKAKLSKDHKALKYLWARERIKQLDDYRKLFSQDVKQEVIELGIKYNLATQYTSFVAVDQEIVNKRGKLNSVKQPLPLPQNVNNTAVGTEARIKGKSTYKRSYRIHIESDSNKSEKRKLKMIIMGSYSKIIKTYLQKFHKIRVRINKEGKIVSVEREKNGLWLADEGLKQVFNQLPKSLGLKSEAILTFTAK